ncbi:MAG: signal recognition particle-docking protein FtsY [Nitrospirae bacterium]|nr:signal recognition particle-docking protein FtsY [Nitrospirota bacterium]
MNFLKKLSQGLSRTKEQLTRKIEDLVVSWKGPDPSLMEQMEEILITADIGVSATEKLLDRIRSERCRDGEAVKRCLREGLLSILTKGEGTQPSRREGPLPQVILVIGVNGSGKTTTIGKLAAQFQKEGKKVVLAAGDTFRAAAIEQLEIWGQRSGADVIKHKSGSDPSAVVFDALASAKARGADVLIVDTAGRLHTKVNLMEELKKVTRILAREHPGSPHEVLLVLDATSGQNALSQARIFYREIGITGIILTKLDGTAKGGIIVSIVEELKIPVARIGVGEGVDDLQPFNAREFVEALLN